MVNQVHQLNPQTQIYAQLVHGGRQIPRLQLYRNCTKKVTSTYKTNVAGITGSILFKKPNQSYQQYITEQFIQSAIQMQQCGFDGIELHAAHGYLLNDLFDNDFDQFYDLIQQIRAQTQIKIAVKVSVNQETKLNNLIQLTQIIDLLELSTGNYNTPDKMIKNHSKFALQYVIDNIQQFRQKQCLLCVTGGFHSTQEIEECISQYGDVIDYCGIGRLGIIGLDKHVTRIEFNPLVKLISRFIPLASAGPHTLFYEELQRKIAKSITQDDIQQASQGKQIKNKIDIDKEYKKASCCWWCYTMLFFVFGITTLGTAKDWLN